MIVYSSTKAGFRQDVLTNQIETKILAEFQRAFFRSTTRSEILSWKESMIYMNNVLMDFAIPDDVGIAIEYSVPQTSKRIDFILTGQNEGKDVAVIVELKRWETATLTAKDGVVSTFVGGAEREVSHPSYQAWSYAALLQDFNETVDKEKIQLQPCAYLHNYPKDNVITHRFYAEHLKKAPAFLKEDALKLQEFIKSYVKQGDSKKILYRIDHGRIRPCKSLADKLVSLLKGNQEFIMIDDQKVVYETAVSLAHKASPKNKYCLVVQGGPGTGKSVLAVNLLVNLISQELNVRYVTKNAAPRAVYESMLTGSFTRTHISNLFTGSGAFTETKPNTFDVLLVDEAHRLNKKSGMFQNKGENQIKEIMISSALSVFFIDEDQKVTLKDIGTKDEIKEWAKKLNVKVQELELESQFRCNGSDGYLAWLDNVLQIRETANPTLEGIDYDFQIFDNPNELRDLIHKKNKVNNKARVVAGYCWDWISAANKNDFDIQFPEFNFKARWNLKSDGSLWILNPESVSEIGCIHTSQGLEVDYIGVIVGEDLIVRDGQLITDFTKRSQMDSSVKGLKRLLKEAPTEAKKTAERIVKNTYRTLMTRGFKGCYVYFADKETAEYFKDQLGRVGGSKQNSFSEEKLSRSDFVVIPDDELDTQKKFIEYLPVYSLEAAASGFGREEHVELLGWWKVGRKINLDKNMFIAKVVGKSMEPTIPDGSDCIFRFKPEGSRAGMVVLVESRLVDDPEINQKFTVKRYASEKEFFDDGTWRHKKIVLKPDNKAFQDIVIKNVHPGDFRLVAEFVCVVN